MTTGQIDPRYGDASAAAPAWQDIEQLLTDAQLYWIVTVRADGRPHAVPLVGVWHAGAFAFCTGAEEQKHRNLEGDPRVAVATGSTGARAWDSGREVVVEGTAVRVRDHDADVGDALVDGPRVCSNGFGAGVHGGTPSGSGDAGAASPPG